MENIGMVLACIACAVVGAVAMWYYLNHELKQSDQALIQERDKLKQAQDALVLEQRERIAERDRFNEVVFPLQGPTEILWRKEDVQIISKNAFIEDGILYPTRKCKANSLIVLLHEGEVWLYRYVGPIVLNAEK